MSEENNTGNNLIWAITTLIIVAIIAGALYYSGFLGGAGKPKTTNVEVSVPSGSTTTTTTR
jgi:cell division protein YceG involved in septum cleavage